MASQSPRGSSCDKTLSQRERAFVVAFVGEAAGNATKAAILAGYRKASARFQGCRLAKRRNIAAKIATLLTEAQHAAQEAHAAEEAATIADVVERRTLLTTIARDTEQHPLARIKAVDIHNKMDGIYVQKHELSGKVTLVELLAGEAVPA